MALGQIIQKVKQGLGSTREALAKDIQEIKDLNQSYGFRTASNYAVAGGKPSNPNL